MLDKYRCVIIIGIESFFIGKERGIFRGRIGRSVGNHAVWRGATAKIRMAEKKKEAPRLQVDPDKPCYNVRETAVLLDLTPGEVRRLIRDGKLAAKKYGASYIIRRESIAWWTTQQKLFAES